MPAHALPWVWGATSREVAATYPSEAFAAPGAARAVRAVDVEASTDDVFLWLCQLRRAPYSYDLVDNLGRRSPRTPDLTLVDVAVGDTIASVFRVVDVVPGRSITMVPLPGRPTRLFGQLVMTYVTSVAEQGTTRLVGVLEIPRGRGPLSRITRSALVWGDLVMMRKQLQTLARLAEGG